MSETQQDIEQLWAVSELEQRVATQPDAASMRKLADHYDELGWPDEARQLRDRADILPTPKEAVTIETKTSSHPGSTRDLAAKASEETVLKGRFTPRSLVEIFKVLHLTGKSGKLVAEGVGNLAATVTIVKGSLIEAHATGGETGEAALHLAVRIKGGIYQFTASEPSTSQPNLSENSAALIAAFVAEVAHD